MMKEKLGRKKIGLVCLLAAIAFTWIFSLPCQVYAEKDTIKIGVVLPLSGGLELFG